MTMVTQLVCVAWPGYVSRLRSNHKNDIPQFPPRPSRRSSRMALCKDHLGSHWPENFDQLGFELSSPCRSTCDDHRETLLQIMRVPPTHVETSCTIESQNVKIHIDRLHRMRWHYCPTMRVVYIDGEVATTLMYCSKPDADRLVISL